MFFKNLALQEEEASYLSSQTLARFRIFSWSGSVPRFPFLVLVHRKPLSRSSRTPPAHWELLTPPGSISSTKLARCSGWELLSQDLPYRIDYSKNQRDRVCSYPTILRSLSGQTLMLFLVPSSVLAFLA